LLAGPLTGLGLPSDAVPIVGSVVGVAIATLFSMVVGELVPKNLALALPLATAKVVVPFQALFTTVFKPLILLFNNTANAIIRAMGVEPKEELSGARSAEELISLVRRSAREGSLDQDHATLLGRSLRFSDHSVSDVMTPRVRMVRLPATASAADVLTLSQREGVSRFPVIGVDVDDVVGVAHVKQAFALEPVDQQHRSVSNLMVPPLRVPESMGIDTLLGLLRRGWFQLAIVLDEHGGTAGLVTLEDLVEELVGDLRAEHDRTRADVVRDGGSILLDASLRPDELMERTGIRVPDDREYETVGGFVVDQLDRLPEVGDEVAVDEGRLRLELVDGAAVHRLRYTPNLPNPVPVDADGRATSRHDQIVEQLREDLDRG
jgi:CBS domain containing-hemolysin-like protein